MNINDIAAKSVYIPAQFIAPLAPGTQAIALSLTTRPNLTERHETAQDVTRQATRPHTNQVAPTSQSVSATAQASAPSAQALALALAARPAAVQHQAATNRSAMATPPVSSVSRVDVYA